MKGSTDKRAMQANLITAFLGALLASFHPQIPQREHFNVFGLTRSRPYPTHTFGRSRRRRLKGWQKGR